MISKLAVLYLLTSFSVASWGQVINDRIEDRILLNLDSGWHSSFTTKSDVEWNCINKALTNKCLIYHNDQWFTIRPRETGPFYLNVSRQNCKQLQGVQMVIIEGDPCKTSSYQLKKCIPFTDQSDFFVKLDSLNPDTEYLINIDGYLGDRCAFDIAFSSTYHGVPIDDRTLPGQALTINSMDSVIQLQWGVHDSVSFSIRQFYVYRKNAKEKSALLIAMPNVHNAFGAAEKNYSVTDTLRLPGEYTYSIYGSTSNDMMLLSREGVRYSSQPQPPAHSKSSKRQIEYFMPNDASIKVDVSDNKTGKHLFSTTKKATKGRNTLTLDFASVLEKGQYTFLIVLSNKHFREERVIRFPEGQK